MRIVLVLALVAPLARAQPDPARDIKFALWIGIDRSVHKAFANDRDVEMVARQPRVALDVCRYAVDTAFLMGLVHHNPEKGVKLADRFQSLAELALQRSPGNADARRALVEARIYRAKIMEALAASALRLGFPAKPLVADHAKRWNGLVEAIAELATDEDTAMRAIELQLEALHYIGTDRARCMKGLVALAKKANEAPAARAAVLLAEALASEDGAAKAQAGLDQLKLHLAAEDTPAVRRHNDLVTLAKLRPAWKIVADYQLVPCPVTEKGMHVALPLSRSWRVLEWTSHVTGERQLRAYRLTPAGEELSRVRFENYVHGWKYPLSGSGKKVDGKNAKKLAVMLYEKDKDFGLIKAAKKKKRRSPKRVKLSKKVKSAYFFEIVSQGPKFRPWHQRLRVWIFAAKQGTYGIRVSDGENDGVEKLHPELAAVLAHVRGD